MQIRTDSISHFSDWQKARTLIVLLGGSEGTVAQHPAGCSRSEGERTPSIKVTKSRHNPTVWPYFTGKWHLCRSQICLQSAHNWKQRPKPFLKDWLNTQWPADTMGNNVSCRGPRLLVLIAKSQVASTDPSTDLLFWIFYYN